MEWGCFEGVALPAQIAGLVAGPVLPGMGTGGRGTKSGGVLAIGSAGGGCAGGSANRRLGDLAIWRSGLGGGVRARGSPYIFTPQICAAADAYMTWAHALKDDKLSGRFRHPDGMRIQSTVPILVVDLFGCYTEGVQFTAHEPFFSSGLVRQGLFAQKKGSKPAAGSKKKKAAGVLDLDHLSDGSDIDDGSGQFPDLIDNTRDRYLQLKQKYQGKCEQCSKDDPEVWCKIDVDGNHSSLSYMIRNSWSHSLASEEHGVTLDCPPNSELFKTFHVKKSATSDSAKFPAPASLSLSLSTMPSTGSSFMELMTMSMMESQQTNTVLLATALGRNSVGPSQPAGSSVVSPSRQPARRPKGIKIDDFVVELDAAHPERDISRFLPIFREEEVRTVPNILRGGEKFLTSGKIGMKEATATWFLKKTSMDIS
ncbi:hypothetical protein GGX14DRAFT_616422 [Mycena pura]|uniref:Uncharacterized protein n=1 Tax=Mycena pura TaxID=153505 RepID=A0AAD6YU00_9AGAR|nr:hypothetical protein GGX14DRAFT_616422 [Mycena pura]